MFARSVTAAFRHTQRASVLSRVTRSYRANVSTGALVGAGLAASFLLLDQRHYFAKQGEETNLRSLFEEYASGEGPNKEKRMTQDDVRKLLGGGPKLFATTQALCGLISSSGSGSLSFEEFEALFELLQRPDAEYLLAFKLADKDRTGFITKEEFKSIVMKHLPEGANILNWSSDWVNLFFGKEGEGHLSYLEFTQLLAGLQEEQVRQSFLRFYNDKTGLVSPDLFMEILEAARIHLPPGMTEERVRELARVTNPLDERGEGISYAQYRALSRLIIHLPQYAHVISGAIKSTGRGQVTKDEFLREAQRQCLAISPMEAHLAFFFFDTNKDEHLDLPELSTAVELAENAAAQHVHLVASPLQGYTTPKEHESMIKKMADAGFHFGLGAIAGGIGATAVYPIDLVKTRMQNQRSTKGAERLYKHSFDCFAKTIQNEGFVGLYRGIGPQLVGVAPEKAIKLTMNDLLRGTFSDDSGNIKFPLELVAGGGAGASQVIFTNPLEIVKIRLQVQGEAIKRGLMSAAEKQSAMAIVRELGISGLYKGASACLLRDIPFSAIYFPTYAKMKHQFSTDGTPQSAGHLLLAGAIAGVPAAGLVTPADVIKTRLQVKQKQGDIQYSGIVDCANKIMRTEGFSAFWKGSLARVFRSSPQFGVTLVSYELLQRLFGISTDSPPKTLNVPVTASEMKVFHGFDTKMRNVEEKWFNVYSK